MSYRTEENPNTRVIVEDEIVKIPLKEHNGPNISLEEFIERLERLRERVESKETVWERSWLEIREEQIDEFGHTEDFLVLVGERLESQDEFDRRKNHFWLDKWRHVEELRGNLRFFSGEEGKKIIKEVERGERERKMEPPDDLKGKHGISDLFEIFKKSQTEEETKKGKEKVNIV
jgi:hypothetical protein